MQAISHTTPSCGFSLGAVGRMIGQSLSGLTACLGKAQDAYLIAEQHPFSIEEFRKIMLEDGNAKA